MKKQQKILTVTAKDCKWDYYRGRGKGGQKRNKTSNAVRCRHLPSGAIGKSEDRRSQYHNKQTAFKRMAQSKEFQQWIRIESARITGEFFEIERKIEKELKDNKKTITEIKNERGKWTKKTF